jgi:hypothetical protein
MAPAALRIIETDIDSNIFNRNELTLLAHCCRQSTA